MIHLRSVEFKKTSSEKFPYTINFIKDLREIKFESPITFLIGENGSGKSTILEGIAAAIELTAIGSSQVSQDETLNYAKEYSENIRPIWNIRTHRGFFLRSEDFFGFTKQMNSLKSELVDQKQESENKYTGYARLLTVGSASANIHELEKRYGENADSLSHGESFLNLFRKRIVPKGLYILDEPEVPLSPKSQLSLITIIAEAIKKDCQFIIATHSPMLLAIPDSTILVINDGKLEKTNYEDVEFISLFKSFLNNPERFLQHLI